jgi:phenylpropionate dioxygenase-like ring-hydroxylating dioxygenase large terminal subunit
MIRDQWYPILESNEVKNNNKPVGVKRLNEKLVLWRGKDHKVNCIADRCAHRGASLSCGKIIEGEVQCPFHGLQFNKTGLCTYIPSRGKTAPVPSNFKVNYYPVKEDHGFIWIWWGEPREEYPELPWFPELNKSFSYGTLKDPWTMHYSRCIENQLDVAHLFVVHYNTIGRGDQRVCDGPVSKLNPETNSLDVWYTNHKENGTQSILPNDMPEPDTPSFLEFRFPNLWQLKLSTKGRIFVAFVPVDEENTMLYMRFYQKFIKIPIFNKFIAKVSAKSSTIILHQDRRVVQTQIPKKTEYKMDIPDNLFPADYPIVLYRKRREELKQLSLNNK